MVHIPDVQSPIFLPCQQYHFFKDTLRESGSFFVLMWTTNSAILKIHFFMILQEINVVHISDVVRPIFCLSNDTTFIKILKQKVVQCFVKCEPHIVTFLKKIFNLFSWTTSLSKDSIFFCVLYRNFSDYYLHLSCFLIAFPPTNTFWLVTSVGRDQIRLLHQVWFYSLELMRIT